MSFFFLVNSKSLHAIILVGHYSRLRPPTAKEQGTPHSPTHNRHRLNILLSKIVYEPKVKYHVGDKKPPRISDSLFGWLPPLIHTKEPELLDKIGPDAVTFLRFLRMLRWMFTAISILCCGILIPINIYYNTKVNKNPSQNILLLLTVRDVRGVWLWAHVVMTYVITFVVFAFIYVHWNAMVRMRGIWFRSAEYMNSFYARTLMIQGVPKKFQSDEGIRAIFQSMQMPYPTTSVHVGRRVGNLPDLIEKHNNSVRELEYVLVRYLKGGKLGKKRPTVNPGGGCGGKKVDAIDYYTCVCLFLASSSIAC
jgi:calcium permeable stress-gated cation channel